LDARGDGEEEMVFDFPSALQGVADVLAADAAARGVELVIGQVGFGRGPSPISTPSASDGRATPQKEEKVTESRQLLVRADERAWSVVLVWVRSLLEGIEELSKMS
jgi:hypothetical protein